MVNTALGLQDLLELPWTFILQKDGDTVAGRVFELPGCFSQGDTYEQTLLNLRDALEIWLTNAMEEGLEIPDPMDAEDLLHR